VSFVIAMAFVIIIAASGQFLAIANFLTSLITTPQGLIILCASLIGFLIVYILLRETRLNEKKRLEKERLKQNEQIINKTGEAISVALKE
jgi:uncharacterized membrane protein